MKASILGLRDYNNKINGVDVGISSGRQSITNWPENVLKTLEKANIIKIVRYYDAPAPVIDVVKVVVEEPVSETVNTSTGTDVIEEIDYDAKLDAVELEEDIKEASNLIILIKRKKSIKTLSAVIERSEELISRLPIEYSDSIKEVCDKQIEKINKKV